MERNFANEKASLGTVTTTVKRYRSGWRVYAKHSNGMDVFVSPQRKTKREAEADLASYTPKTPASLFGSFKYIEVAAGRTVPIAHQKHQQTN